MQETIIEELNGSKSRYEKGLELNKQGKVSIKNNGLFKVCGYYEVDTDKMVCNCPDHRTRNQPCKHIFASLLFTKNRGKQTIEHLDGYSNGCKPASEAKHTPKKLQEAHNKDLDKQATITRLATLNTATEILKTHRKPVELNEVLSLASRLEMWALGKWDNPG